MTYRDWPGCHCTCNARQHCRSEHKAMRSTPPSGGCLDLDDGPPSMPLCTSDCAASMCMHVHAWACMCMHVHAGARRCMHVHACVCMCMHVHACACMGMDVHACACICMHVQAWPCVCMHIHACACMSMHVHACALHVPTYSRHPRLLRYF